MLRLMALVVPIAIGDSLNPSTIAPALYLASGERARKSVAAFTAAVLLVHLAGGAAIALGPGQLVLSLLNQLGQRIGDILAIAAGAAMTTVAGVMWYKRRRLAQKELPSPNPKGRSSALLGATIIAVELPTAFPYFAAIALIIGSRQPTASQALPLVLYNTCFVLPLIAILLTLMLAGDEADTRLTRARASLQRRWPSVVALLLLLVGVSFAALGAGALI